MGAHDTLPPGFETGRLTHWDNTHGYLEPEYGRGTVLLHARELGGHVPTIGERFDYVPELTARGHYATHVSLRNPRADD